MTEIPKGNPERKPEIRELDMQSIGTRLPKRWLGFLENVADLEDTTVRTVLHQAVAAFIKDKAMEYESGNFRKVIEQRGKAKEDERSQKENGHLRTTAALDQSLDMYFDPFSAAEEQHDQEI